MSAARRYGAAVAGFGLPGCVSEWPTAPLQGEEWRELLRLLRRQRLSGLAVDAAAGGALCLTEAQHDQLLELHQRAVCGALILEAGLLTVTDELAAAGVESRVLKGAAVAQLDYRDPAQRLFGDVDLLVRGEQFDEAVAALTAAGHARRFPQPRPGFDRRFSKGASFYAKGGFEIDLHRTFVMGPFGLLVDLDDVWSTSSSFTLGGRTLTALSPEHRFLHACYHSALGDVRPRLVPMRDVVEMLLRGRLDMALVRDRMPSWQAQPVVARAVALAWATLNVADIIAISAWAAGYSFSAQEKRFLGVYLDPGGSYAAKELAALSALPGFRDKISFLRALALPRRDYLEGRHAGRLHRLRRAAAAARRGALVE